MTDIEETMVATLRAHAGVSGLVSARIWPVMPPANGAMPALSYQLISRPLGESDALNTGPLEGISRYQFDCWASVDPNQSGGGYAQTRSLANYVISALVALKASGYDVTVENVFDMPEPEIARHRRVVELTIVHGAGE